MADRTYYKGQKKLTGEETDLDSMVNFAFADSGLSAPTIEADMKMLIRGLTEQQQGSTLLSQAGATQEVDEQFFADRLQKASPNVKHDFGDLAKRMYKIYQQQLKKKPVTGTTLLSGAAQ